MSKTIHFVSGLPRSCSTLLCNLLAQNPRVHATPTSPLHEIGYIARQVFQTEEAKAVGGPYMEKMFYDYSRGGVAHAYDSLTDRPVVVDKCRSWIGHLDQTFAVWPDTKVLVPVRDVRGIICSTEKKRRQHPAVFNGAEKANPANFTTIEKRAQAWLSSPPVGIAIERLHEAVRRHRDRLFFVNADVLTRNPGDTMRRIWEYLGEDDFDGHNFDAVEQYTQEYDVGFPYGDHTIRSRVEPLPQDYAEILGENLSNQIAAKFNWIKEL